MVSYIFYFATEPSFKTREQVISRRAERRLLNALDGLLVEVGLLVSTDQSKQVENKLLELKELLNRD